MSIKFATGQVGVGTGTGNLDLTVSGFGTPKAALFFLTAATANDTITDHALLGIGCTDGTRHWVQTTRDRDAVNPTESDKWGMTDEAIALMEIASTAIDFEANFDSWITDGVRLNIGAAASSSYLLNYLLLGGSGMTAYADTATHLASGSAGQNFTAPGFQGDVGIFVSNWAGFGDSGVQHHSMNYGFASRTSPIRQGMVSIFNEDNRGVSSRGSAYASDAKVISRIDQSGSLINFALSSWLSDGFTLTRTGTGLDTDFGYLILSFGGEADYDVRAFTTPTSTGSFARTGLGFQPSFVQLIGSFAATLTETQISDSGGAGAMMISNLTAAAQYSTAVASQDGTTGGNTASLVNNKAAHMLRGNITEIFEADFTSFDSDGYTINFTTTQGNAKRWFELCIEGVADAGGETVTPAAEEAASSTVDPTVVLGAVSVTPTAEEVTSATVDPTVVLGAVSVTPAAEEAASSTVDPSVSTGSGNVEVAPAAEEVASATVDPTVVLGSISISPTAAEAAGETVDPTVVLGALSITPAAQEAAGTTVDPAVAYGATSVTPAAEEATSATVDPTTVLGSLSIMPAAEEAQSETVDPTVSIGSPPITPDAQEAASSTENPTVVLGDLSVTPAAEEATGTSSDPVVLFGSVSVTPAAESATSSTVDPPVVLGSLSVAPASADAASSTVDPSVQEGGDISVAPEALDVTSSTVDPGFIYGAVSVTPAAESVTSETPSPIVHYGSTSAQPASSDAASSAVDPTVINTGPVVIPAAVSAAGTTLNPTLVLGSVTVQPEAAVASSSTENPVVLPEVVTESSLVISNNHTWLPVQEVTQDGLKRTLQALNRPPPDSLDSGVLKLFGDMRDAVRYLFEAFEKQVRYNDQLRLGVDDAIRAVHQRVDLSAGAGNLADRPPPAPDGIRYTAIDEDPPVTYVAKDGVWVVAA